MKVAQFIDSYYPVIDGVAVCVDNYTKYLKLKGVDCLIVTSGHQDAQKEVEILRSKFMTNPLNKSYNTPLASIDYQLKHELNKRKFDLIHAHSPFIMGHLGLKIAKKKKIPMVATFHTKLYDDFLESTHSKVLAKLLLKYVIKFYQECDYVLTVSEHAKKTLFNYGYQGKVKIIPNGVNLTMPRKRFEVINDIREEYRLKANEDIFLYVGQLSFKKNIRLIYEALALYKKHNPFFKLLMVGTGNHKNEIKKLGRTLGIHENIIYIGKLADREKLTGIFLTAHLFLFPSTYDTFSLVVKEAAFCETPSIVVKDTGASEGIIHQVNGFLCDENVNDLVKQIKKAISNKKDLLKIGKKASKTLPITWELVVEEVFKFYEEIFHK